MRRIFFQLAATALLISAAASLRAQITDPNNLIAPPPPPIQFRGKHLVKPTTDFQWLWQYTQPVPNGNESGLLGDAHFTQMLQNNLKAPQSFFRDGAVPLPEVAATYFGVSFSSVRTNDNRYVTFTGCVPHQCGDHGLIWVDTSVERPTLVFAATQWTTQGAPIEDPNAAFDLWIFPSRTLDASLLPPALTRTLAQWNSTQHQHIHAALLVDPDGAPHTLNLAALGAHTAAK